MEYTSRYPQLGFYVGGNVRYFSGGRYVAESPEEIGILDSIPDALRIEPEEVSTVVTEDKPAKAPRRPSAK